jgi:hypothetical protein
MIPKSYYSVWSVEMDRETIAICESEDDADNFIEWYKKMGHPSPIAKFVKTKRAVLAMENKE